MSKKALYVYTIDKQSKQRIWYDITKAIKHHENVNILFEYHMKCVDDIFHDYGVHPFKFLKPYVIKDQVLIEYLEKHKILA